MPALSFYEFIPTAATFITILSLIVLSRCFIQPVDENRLENQMEESLIDSEKFLSVKRWSRHSGS